MVNVEQCLSDLAENLDALFNVQSHAPTHGGCELMKITLRTIFSEQFGIRIIPRSTTVRKVLIAQDVPVLAFLKHVILALDILHSMASLPAQDFADVELWFESSTVLAFAAPT